MTIPYVDVCLYFYMKIAVNSYLSEWWESAMGEL